MDVIAPTATLENMVVLHVKHKEEQRQRKMQKTNCGMPFFARKNINKPPWNLYCNSIIKREKSQAMRKNA